MEVAIIKKAISYNYTKSVDAWLSKKTNKYISHDIQDELLEEMAHKILVDIGDGVRNGGFLDHSRWMHKLFQ